ncbi:MAG: D-alanyl-D-alanine carboxypeptidase [Clostridia bacterium]|nr:D-alanyl-D-alanine carboxypeptidase [Clostridia bacterium]
MGEMMKKTHFLCLLTFCLVFLLPTPVSAVPAIGARSAVLIDAASGTVLYGKNENMRRGMASTTKIMTALITLERIPTDTVVSVAPEACGIEGSSVYLTPGEQITVESLLYALMLQSANDAAEALAYAVAGSREAFVALMNEKALSLGLTDTHFENPHGLDGEHHYTTAYELALLAAHALKNDVFCEIVSTKRCEIPLANGEATRLLINHNRLLREYDDIIGVKTGYTRACGRTLVSAAERDGVRLVCVTLDDGNDWADHRAMLDYGFSLYEERLLAAAGDFSFSVPVCGGVGASVTVSNPHALSVMLPRTDTEISVVTELPRFLYGGVRAGQTVGMVRFYLDGTELGAVTLVAEQDVEVLRVEKRFLKRLIDFIFQQFT